MTTVERWLEFDKDLWRKKFTNQCLGLLLVMALLLVSSHARPLTHPLTLVMALALAGTIVLQPKMVTSSLPWRLCSMTYMVLLAAALRSELHYMGTAGQIWLLPSAGGMLLVASLFMTRGVDYIVIALGIWPIFLAAPPGLLEDGIGIYVVIYVVTITGFGLLMNRSFILGTLRLMKARDDFRLLSETDALTGLENRRRFIGRIEQLVAENSPALLLLLDVDHFKRINDRWGHSVGDQALVKIAEAIRSGPCVSASARLGGEEFAVILSCSGPEDYLPALRAFSRHLAQFDLPTTLSGGAVWLGHEKNSVAALVAADVQMYAAKDAGRHRIFFNSKLACQTAPEQPLAC